VGQGRGGAHDGAEAWGSCQSGVRVRGSQDGAPAQQHWCPGVTGGGQRHRNTCGRWRRHASVHNCAVHATQRVMAASATVVSDGEGGRGGGSAVGSRARRFRSQLGPAAPRRPGTNSKRGTAGGHACARQNTARFARWERVQGGGAAAVGSLRVTLAPPWPPFLLPWPDPAPAAPHLQTPSGWRPAGPCPARCPRLGYMPVRPAAQNAPPRPAQTTPAQASRRPTAAPRWRKPARSPAV
jgi:hypothetical protein